MSRPACLSSCTALSISENLILQIPNTFPERIGCVSCLQVPSYWRMRLIVFSIGYVIPVISHALSSLTQYFQSVRVKESKVFSRKYCTEVTSLSTLSVFEVEIWCYRGGDTTPKWILRKTDDFSTLCMVQADLSPLSGSAQPQQGQNGKTYWSIVFSVEIHFGLTEFKARIKWVDNVGICLQYLLLGHIAYKTSINS